MSFLSSEILFSVVPKWQTRFRLEVERTNQLILMWIHELDTKDSSWFSKMTFSFASDVIESARDNNIHQNDIRPLRYYDSVRKSRMKYETLQKTTSDHIWYSLFHLNKNRLLFIFLVSMLLAPITYIPSFFLNLILKFLSKGGPYYIGILLGLGLFVFYILRTLLETHFTGYVTKVSYDIQSLLQSLIYKKLLHSAELYKYDIGHLLNLMSLDIEFIQIYLGKVYQMWQAPLSVIFGLILLYLFSGSAIFVGIICFALMIPLTMTVTQMYLKTFSKLTTMRAKRTKFVNEILLSNKHIKLYNQEKKYLILVSHDPLWRGHPRIL